ncbi:TerC family protein (plasmid) [Pontibacillus sp. ALD_SL1]|uniref:TerC family protein n=1 Tax=Pontibacillus sp. ALD_SL1 TaxID=2777185 RepID=UPI001A978338|nr:TerC family protein [Pontibacillus sp. ALD_SL1]QST02323.1 TerC family protein [Pontibacillus sp. ALD_SL1]
MTVFGIPLDDLLKVILIDLLLSGDNALIIAMAAKNVPKEKRKYAIFWGTFGAISLRIIFAFLIVFLLGIPYLSTIGGVLLLWISFKLLVDSGHHNTKEGGASILSVIATIIWADAAMSLDNVLALAGVAHGNVTIIVIGIIISIPIIIWGSALIVSAIDKYPIVIFIGAGLLSFTAGEMIIADFDAIGHGPLHYIIPTILALFVMGAGYVFKTKKGLH